MLGLTRPSRLTVGRSLKYELGAGWKYFHFSKSPRQLHIWVYFFYPLYASYIIYHPHSGIFGNRWWCFPLNCEGVGARPCLYLFLYFYLYMYLYLDYVCICVFKCIFTFVCNCISHHPTPPHSSAREEGPTHILGHRNGQAWITSSAFQTRSQTHGMEHQDYT